MYNNCVFKPNLSVNLIISSQQEVRIVYFGMKLRNLYLF